MNREQRIDDVMNSLDGLQPAYPGDSVWDGIVQRIRKSKSVPMYTVSIAAASALLLLLANLYFITQPGAAGPDTRSNADPMQEVIEYYGLTDDNRLGGL